ncbi:MAG TPA: MG2 domain-containing protein [Candidatus Hydrogenedens sp.]|nr:MG2 domain-containing protein [Candidatus Hydrogenedens sp.]
MDNVLIQSVGGEIEISGNWKTGVEYTLKWKAGLKWGLQRTEQGNFTARTLESDYIYTLRELPEIRTLDFDNKDKFYIIPYHEKNFIRVGSRNVPKAYLHVYQVITENLPVWLGNTSSNRLSFEINEKTTKYITAIPIEFSDSVDKTSYVNVDLTQYLTNYSKGGIFTLCLSDTKEPGKLRASWEPSESKDGGNGIYEWDDYYDDESESNDDENRFYADVKGARSSIRYVLWTKLGLVSHWDNTSLVGFVHDLIDLSPQAGALVSAYSIKNNKVAEGTTDNNGIFKLLLDNQDTETPRLITVKTEKDFTFVFLTPKPLPMLKDLEKYDNYDKNKYDAFVYTDRNLYRPGELIHSRWIVRNNYGSEVINAPLELRFINPLNRIVQRKVVNSSEWGTGSEDITTETTYLTGAYTLGLYIPGGEQICGSVPVHIEDFVPDRIKTELTVPDNFWIVGTKQKFEILSQYYVGPPASNLSCKGKLIITSTTFENKKWKGYHFGNSEFFKTVVIDLGTQNTDSEGKTEFSFDFSPPGVINKPIEIAVIGEASEFGGRAVSAVKRVKGYPEETICGLGVEKIGDKLQIAVALVDKDFNPAPDSEVDVFLERVDWGFVNRVYSEGSGRTLPQWDRVFTIIEQTKVKTKDGKATTHLSVPPFYNSYRIRVQKNGMKAFSDVTFYCVPQKIMYLEEGPPELVKIHIEDKKWYVGEAVPVSVEVPFDGKAIAVIQGERVWDAKAFDIVSGRGVFSFNIDEKYFPNVWVGVSAIHLPTKEETISPYSTFSFAKVEIEKPERKLNIVISKIPEEVRPQNSVELDVQTTTIDGKPVPAELTVAAVDEGIHAILGYTLPDPYLWFGRTRYSPICRVHYYDHVAYDYDPSSPSGDMIARQLSAGKPEIGESWIKPVALWSGTIRTDEQGFAKVAFDLPEFNGTLRIVTVGTNKELLGSAESKMLVRRPCVIQTQLPRFLRPQDKAIIFARSLNSQENPLDVKLSLTSNESISVQPLNLQWESPPKGLGISSDINIVCLSGTNNAQLQWQYNITNKAGDIIDQFSEQTPIPIRIPSIYEQRATTLIVPSGRTINLNTSDFVEDNLLETEIKVGGSPFLQIEPALQWLWEYEYTCCEQKVSRLYALYLFRNFLKDSMSDVISPSDYDKLLMTMVNDIFSHQRRDGGLSLWPYASDSDERASLHAGFLLAMINRDKGLPIPEKSYQRLIYYLSDLGSLEQETRYFSNFEAKAFTTLILALNGDPTACERLNNNLEIDYSRSLRVLLLLGANICGKPAEEIKKYVKQLIWETEKEPEKETWEFSSQRVRMLALQLISKVISNETPESILKAQKPLIEYLTKNLGYTTYDLAMVLMALDMSFKKLNIQPQECTAQVKVNDIEQLVQGTKILKSKKQGATQIDIHNTGKSPVYVFWCIRGVSKNPSKYAQANNLEFKQFIYNCQKKLGATTPFTQGETYLLVFATYPKFNMDNLILTQLLPAGFEIENPRLKREQINELIPESLLKTSSIINPEHVEIRDDKLIVAFPELTYTSKDVRYIYVCVVRAITRGSFEFPGARIEDMYNPETFACLATEQIEVK